MGSVAGHPQILQEQGKESGPGEIPPVPTRSDTPRHTCAAWLPPVPAPTPQMIPKSPFSSPGFPQGQEQQHPLVLWGFQLLQPGPAPTSRRGWVWSQFFLLLLPRAEFAPNSAFWWLRRDFPVVGSSPELQSLPHQSRCGSMWGHSSAGS